MAANEGTSIRVETALAQKLGRIRTAIVEYASGGQRRCYPWREPGRSPYEVLIAEVLLKRTTAKAAARLYLDFLRKFPTLQDLDSASQEEIVEALTPVGLQWQRARSVKALVQHLVENEGGTVPSDLQHLLHVPGVGNYSARAVLSFAYNTPAAVVDSNVERILQRVFLDSFPPIPGQPLYQSVADRLLPPDHHREYNWGMLDLGALVCRPGIPRCSECPLTGVCDYYQAMGRRKAVESRGEVPVPALSQPSTLSGHLRAARKAKGLSLVGLSKQAKVSKLTIIKIEAGRTTPKPATILKLATALGLTPKDLTGQPPHASSLPM